MKKFNRNLFYIFLTFIMITIINKLIFFTSTLKNKLYSNNGYYYQWKFGKIFYTVRGNGIPLLLIHGLNSGSSDYEFNKLINHLSTRYTVYTIDLIGYGRSDKPKITYTAYLYVQLITDFIKEVIKEPTNVISSSSSSAFVTMACHQDASLFDKLLFINPTKPSILAKNTTKKDQFLKHLLETPILGTLIYNIATSKSKIRTDFKTKLYLNKKAVKRKYIDTFYEAAHLNGAHSKFIFASRKCKYLNVNIGNALENINNCIYIALGENIHTNTTEIIDEYTQLNPSIEYSMISNSKLLPQLERPKDILEICNIYFV